MNSAKFNSPEHNRKEHGTTETDDEIAEVPPPKFALSAPSQPKNTAILVQHSGTEHMIDNMLPVLQR